jgi:hypothetical protein
MVTPSVPGIHPKVLILCFACLAVVAELGVGSRAPLVGVRRAVLQLG